ncbi:hypothetical protein MMC10_008765 [Thelotrema lepadinum]|nr:hypothetical protein [Thelotrema lepadinum]
MHLSNFVLLSAPLIAAAQIYSPSDIYARDAAQADVAAAQQQYASSVQKMQGKMQQQQNQLAKVVQSQAPSRRRDLGFEHDGFTTVFARDAAQADVAAAQQKYAKSVQNMQGKMQQQNNQLAKVVQSQAPSRRRDLGYDTLYARDASQADVIAAQNKFNQGAQKMQQDMQQKQIQLQKVVQGQAPSRRDLEIDALLADLYARDALAEADPEAFDDEELFDFY